MNEVLKSIYSRRTVRSYTEEPVAEDVLKEIINAGVHAPNGMNVQPLRFVVVTDRKALDRYNVVAKTRYSANLKASIDANPKAAEQIALLKKMDDPAFNMFYEAPSLVLVFAAPGALTPAEDGTLCAENMILAAHSMGIGSCWVGFASPLGEDPQVLKELEVPAGHKLIAQLIFGHPKERDGRPTPRKEPVILKWVK